MGDSLLVVGDDRQLKVHVHTDEPGAVLGAGDRSGTLHEIEIDNMRETDRAARAAAPAVDGIGRPHPRRRGLHPGGRRGVGEGNKRLFRNLGVDLIVEGGQSMNPSAEELLRAVGSTSAPSVVVLPNNKNVIMTAEQMVGSGRREVFVVPTRSMQAGLAALVAFDRDCRRSHERPSDADVLDGVATASITRAVRDSTVDGVAIAEATSSAWSTRRSSRRDAESGATWSRWWRPT